MFAPEAPRSATTAEQQASLRRVAMLVARGAAPADVFAAIAREVARVVGPRLVQILRFERDGTVTVVGTWGESPNPFPVGTNWPWQEPGMAAVDERARGGLPVRVENVGELAGTMARAGREVGIESAAGAPIVVDGKPWGLIAVGLDRGAPLPERIEERLAEFTRLVATAISNTATQERLARLADEQAALRRVATLVARGAPPAAVFDAVVTELGRLLAVGSAGLVRFDDDGMATVVAGWRRLGEIIPVGARLPLGGRNVASQIARTGAPARLDDFHRAATGQIADRARRVDTRAAAGGPVVVAGRVWGAMIAAALEGESLPPDIEPRLEQFTELVATAIANAEARVQIARLADEQAALRRVATLVAEESPAAELFAEVAGEVSSLLGPRVGAAILRFDDDGTATVVAGRALDGSGVPEPVHRERRPVRIDDSAVSCPIVVRGRVWGAIVVAREDEGFAPDTEARVLQFAKLVSTAIANAEARAQLERLAAEQAALRRVATLVAEAAAPTEVFDAVIAEVAQLLGASQVGMMRAETPDEITIVAHRGQVTGARAGLRMRLDGDSVTARVVRTRRSARLEHYDPTSGPIARVVVSNDVAVTVGAPITVEGRLWGVITASWVDENAPPGDAEERLVEFARLIDTAIANADSRDQLMASRARLLTAGDEARRRVVRDLHDGAQQRLVHTIITLKLAERDLHEDPERTRSLLHEALSHAEQGNNEIRELAQGILPQALTQGGLRAGVDGVVSRIDLPVRTEITGARMPRDIEASAYFIVAEALTNVVKHAQAASAEITAVVDDDTLRVSVRDDGIGGADPNGSGLLGLGDRAAALGGRLRIESPRGGGTVVTAELPLAPPAT